MWRVRYSLCLAGQDTEPSWIPLQMTSSLLVTDYHPCAATSSILIMDSDPVPQGLGFSPGHWLAASSRKAWGTVPIRGCCVLCRVEGKCAPRPWRTEGSHRKEVVPLGRSSHYLYCAFVSIMMFTTGLVRRATKLAYDELLSWKENWSEQTTFEI